MVDEPGSGDAGDASDAAAERDAGDDAAEAPGRDSRTSERDADDGVRSREVVVPLRLYKTVTVFSTLVAVAAVVLGFVALDVATQRASLPASEINPVLAGVGVALIAAGGLVYAFASRFRAEGMRKDKDDSDEHSGNG